jgi:hypothetical protein
MSTLRMLLLSILLLAGLPAAASAGDRGAPPPGPGQASLTRAWASASTRSPRGAPAAPPPTAVIATGGGPAALAGWYRSPVAPLLQAPWPGALVRGAAGSVDRFRQGPSFFDVLVVANPHHVTTAMALALLQGALPGDDGLGAPRLSVVVVGQYVPLLVFVSAGTPYAALVVAIPQHLVGAFLTSTARTFRRDLAVFEHALESLRGVQGGL